MDLKLLINKHIYSALSYPPLFLREGLGVSSKLREKHSPNHFPIIILWFFLLLGSISTCPAQQSKDIRIAAVHHPNATLKSKAEYYYDPWSEQEIRHGRYTEWDTKGAVVYEATYVDGKLMGKAIHYFPTGQIASQEQWFNGKREGLSEAYYPNGTLKYRGMYVADKLEGEVLYFYADGKAKKREIYKEGLLDGISTRYNRKGKVIKETLYQNGLKQAHEKNDS